MDKSRFFMVTHIALLFIIIVLMIFNRIFESCFEDLFNIAILVIAIILDIISMGYFIVHDIFDNYRKLAKHGSLSLFDTIDRKNIVNEVLARIVDGKHVIYIDCKNLPDIETENIKQRLYNDLTMNKKLKIKNVFMPTSLDMETFYELIFFNRPSNKYCKKINIYIYDKHTANYYFIKQIEKKFNDYYNNNAFVFDSIDARKKRWAKNSFIIYLCDDDTTYGIKTSISKTELVEMIENKTGKDFQDEMIKGMTEFNDINKVLVVEEILNDNLNKRIINNDISMIYALYYLKTGRYYEALNVLADKNVYTGKEIDLYKNYVIADTLHLLNCYATASTICESIKGRADQNADNLLNKKTIELHAHIMKHIGFFGYEDRQDSEILQNSSNDLLDFLGKDEESCKLICEKKTINGYFIRLKKVLENNSKGISRDILYVQNLSKIFSANKSPKARMYYAAFSAYNNLIEADKYINDIIEFYEKTDNRLRFNAYYIKAEILRNMQKHAEAYDYYIRSSGIEDGHVDVNLLDQNYFSLKAMEKLGLVQGMGSLCVKNYKARYFTSNGFRLDEKDIRNKLSEYCLPNVDESSCSHSFNHALLLCIDDKKLTKDQLRQILAENIFIIL